MSKIYFGIDLGTSKSSISYIVDSPKTVQSYYIEPATVQFKPPPNTTSLHNWHRLPSVVYIEKKQKKKRVITGFQADEITSDKRAKPFENLFTSVKSDMGTLRIYEDSIHPEIFTPVEVSAEIIKELIKAAEKDTSISPKKCNVVITVPASFKHNQREDTIKAAKLAGLKIEQGDLLDEPVGAFIHMACHQKLDAHLDMKKPKNILMFDLGAGTCDVSIFRVHYDSSLFSSGIGLDIRNKAISNYKKLGGDNIDLHIVEEILLPAVCDKNDIDFNELPEKVKREIRFKLKKQAKRCKEEICRHIEHEGGKKSIKQRWSVDPFYIFALDLKTKKTSGVMNMEEFMGLMDPFISEDIESSYKISDDYSTYSFFDPVYSALVKADMYPDDIDAFVFNGGSCHNPVIQTAFKKSEDFAHAKFIETPDLDLSVSRGAAIHSYYLHSHKKPIVMPIANDEIGIYTLGLKKEPLMEAGTELPFPADDSFKEKDNFYVPQDNIDNVGISIYAGEGQIISNLKLSLPVDIEKGEPVSVGFRIDSNKVMHVSAALVNYPETEINFTLNHPWTHEISNPEELETSELWREVAESKKAGIAVSPDDLITLANRERRSGHRDRALEILQRLQDKDINSASLSNMLALCYTGMGQDKKALRYFREASELGSDEAVYVANYGSQLVEAGKIKDAISILRQSVDIDPENYFPYYWLGYAYRKSGDEERAIIEYKKAKQLLNLICSKHPQSDHYLQFLLDVNRSLGDYEDADRLKGQISRIRNTRILGNNPDNLLAGPESGIWKERDLLVDDQ